MSQQLVHYNGAVRGRLTVELNRLTEAGQMPGTVPASVPAQRADEVPPGVLAAMSDPSMPGIECD